MGKKAGVISEKKQKTSDDLLNDIQSIIEKNLRLQKASEVPLGGRDFAQFIAAFERLKKESGNKKRNEWVEDLKDLKSLEDTCEELQLGDSNKYKSLFDNGKKKEVFLQG